MTASPTTTTSSADTFADVKPGINLTRSFSSPAAADATPTKKDVSWREKLRARRAPEQPGKEKWRDASLSEKERWKEWHKAKDREQKSGLTLSYATDMVKAKNGRVWGATGLGLLGFLAL